MKFILFVVIVTTIIIWGTAYDFAAPGVVKEFFSEVLRQEKQFENKAVRSIKNRVGGDDDAE